MHVVELQSHGTIIDSGRLSWGDQADGEVEAVLALEFVVVVVLILLLYLVKSGTALLRHVLDLEGKYEHKEHEGQHAAHHAGDGARILLLAHYRQSTRHMRDWHLLLDLRSLHIRGAETEFRIFKL